MTVFGSGYRPLDVSLEPTWRRIQALAVTSFRAPFTRRMGLLAYLFTFLPGLGNVIILLVTSGLISFGDAEDAAPSDAAQQFYDPTAAKTYLRLITDQFVQFAFALTAWITCRAIARDRTAGGLELLWTRGLTPIGYFVSHWIGSFVLLALPTLGCQLLIYLVAYTTSADEEFLSVSITPFLRAFGGSAVLLAILTFLPLCLSAIVSRAQLASILWIGGVLGLGAVSGIASEIFRDSSEVLMISPWLAMEELASQIAGTSEEELLFESVASVSVFAIVLGSMAARRLRPTEALA